MDRIRAPYNFVPVADRVYAPEWASKVSHDAPFREGLSGRVAYRVVAETPVFVRGGEPETFFRTPDRRFALPGSALRGMLRNVVEIAGFAKFARVNDHTYGVRDLHNRELYIDHMAELREVPSRDGRGPKKEPVPLVSAGWLRRLSPEARAARRAGATRDEALDEDHDDDVVAEIVPCDFYKIDYRRLVEIANQAGVAGFNPGRKQSSVDKYRAWGTRSLDVKVQAQPLRIGRESERARVPFLGDMGRVVDRGGEVEGRLVFTGQPAEWRADMIPRPGGGHPKHHDFVFSPRPDALPADARGLPVTQKQLRIFEFVHADRGQQNRMRPDPNPEWKHWRERFDRGEPVPVFVLPRPDGTLRAFGLAMMFRLAYAHSVGEAATKAQPGRTDKATRDLAELVFGHVPLDRRTRHEANAALKGRISVGLAVAKGTPKELPVVTAVLGAPKASYYPNYVEQSTDPYNPGAPPSGTYQTFMDDGARVRGWKRYRPHATANLRPPLPPKSTDRVQSRFKPLAEGTVFEGVLRFHNLRPEELGAVVWAARFGGHVEARHTLGMARSLGFGRVRMELVEDAAHPLVTHEGAKLTLADCERRFVAAMEGWAKREGLPGGWLGSMQITQLLGCAVPFPPDADDNRHMLLDHPLYRNEFTLAKKDRLALAPAVPVAEWRKRTPDAPAPVAPGHASSAATTAGRRTSPGARPAAPAPAPAAVALAELSGTIRFFSNGQVGILLGDNRKVAATLGKAQFEGFAALNGNELRRGRAVKVTLAGDVVRVVKAG